MQLSISAPWMRHISFALIFLACLLPFTAQFAAAQRLPTNVVPQRYALKLTPDLETATFTGVETIDVTLKQPSSTITLNSLEIKFQSVSVSAGGAQQTATVSLDEAKQQATFTFPKQLPAGKATLHVRYTGILNNELRGFYLSKARGRKYAVTQFESTDARRAFPSFDEPAYKAVFDITVVAPKSDMVISNSPVQSDTPGPSADQHTVTFSPTVKMSTYLVAFLVGDFQCISGQSDGVPIRVCATPEQVHLTHFALQTAEFALHYYDTYFGIHYPLKKLDLIGIPDFEAGAMENFGAITFRETALLVDPKTASIGSQEVVALDVSHEMAHQWFGDLVTMQWWNNVWLNEGFATWMESKTVAAMHPDWNIPQVVAADEQGALDYDAAPTTHPIRAHAANTPDEINQLFDEISYEKGSDVLLTVENYLGTEIFRKGVHAYLAAHEYGNATTQDFWNAQTATSGKPVDKIMESLITQPGEPILKFGTPANGEVSVQQQRFFLDPEVKPDLSEKWTLPVCFKAGSSRDCQVLTPETSVFKIPAETLFDANAGAKGYYRTQYPAPIFKDLVAHAETRLTPPERIGLIGNEWALVRSNRSTVSDYLNLLEAFKSDPNASVIATVAGGARARILSAGAGGLAMVALRIASSPEQRAQLAAWIHRTFSPEYDKLGPPSPNDSANKRQLRATLFGLLGYYGNDPEVIAQARQIAERYTQGSDKTDPTLRWTALPIAARHGDVALYDRLQHMYETSTNPESQIGALRLLAQFEDPALEERALEYAVSGKVRNQDAAIQLATALEIPTERKLAWSFIRSHWPQIKTLLTPEMGEILVGSAGSFCTAGDRDQVQSFYSTHKVPASSAYLKHAVEQIDGCIQLRQAQEANLKTWLQEQPGVQGDTTRAE
ncbi:MAG TPA: M1 family metallopeptidase [Terracidiphilus sp.]|nr:M1 family metallopeptidase [Terracidiphilus sp.]